MKKTCNRCGHTLEIDKRSCTSCGAFNPFFIAGFSTTKVQSDVFEKQHLEEEEQRLEKERIEKQKREEKIKKELEEAERRHQERLNEMIREAAKTEAASPVKPETVNNLKADLKNEPAYVAANKKAAPGRYNSAPPEQAFKKERPKRWVAITAALVILLTMGGSLTYFYMLKSAGGNSSALHAEVTAAATQPTVKLASVAANDNESSNNAPGSNTIVTKTEEKKTPVVATTVSYKKEATPVGPVKLKHASDFVLTAAKIKNDLVGRKLSGCGITIRKIGDIISLGNPVYIEQLPSGFMKYKVSAKIVQGNEVYNSTPYVYYNANGSFIKVDGTNCE